MEEELFAPTGWSGVGWEAKSVGWGGVRWDGVVWWADVGLGEVARWGGAVVVGRS